MPLALVRSEEKAPEKAEQEAFPLPLEWLAFKDRYPEQWDATVGAAQRKFDAKHNRDKQAEPEQPKSPVEVFYVHTDHLGTPRELTDVAGHIVWAAVYKAWGNTADIERPGRLVTRTQGNTQTQRWEEQSDPVEQNLRFQGQYFDLETGLHYNRFRYYDPDCGRFVSQDPIGLLGGVNNYQYAPNPVGWIDPLGLTTVTPPIITAAEITEKTRTEIRDLANKKGLNPKKTDSTGEPIKWTCPCTGKERLRLDRGHIDAKTGLPYDDPKAAVDHVHAYDPTGKVKIVSPVDGNPHFPTKGE